jgi:hypothetical protein
MSLQKELPHLIHAGLHSARDETVGGVIGGLAASALAPGALTTVGGAIVAAGSAVGVTIGAPLVVGAVAVGSIVAGGIHLIKEVMK